MAAAFAPLARTHVTYVRGALYAAQDIDGSVTWSGAWQSRDVGDARRAIVALAAVPEIPRYVIAHRFAVERLPEFVDWIEHQLLITWDGARLERWHLTADCYFDHSQVLVPGTPAVRNHRPVRREADMAAADDFFTDPV